MAWSSEELELEARVVEIFSGIFRFNISYSICISAETVALAILNFRFNALVATSQVC